MPLTLRSRVVQPLRTTSSAKGRTIRHSSERQKASSKPPTRIDIEDQPPGLTFTLKSAKYGLIQGRIRDNLYAIAVQAFLWNQTRGQMAWPVLFEILAAYPSPLELSKAPLEDLTATLQPIGLQRIRAARLIALAEAWLLAPPCKERRYRRLHYPSRGCGTDVKPGEVLRPGDERVAWEIAHLPGMGAYALNSYRIFYRDRLRAVDDEDGIEAEWKRVVPMDKELKPYLKWRWEKELANG